MSHEGGESAAARERSSNTSPTVATANDEIEAHSTKHMQTNTRKVDVSCHKTMHLTFVTRRREGRFAEKCWWMKSKGQKLRPLFMLPRCTETILGHGGTHVVNLAPLCMRPEIFIVAVLCHLRFGGGDANAEQVSSYAERAGGKLLKLLRKKSAKTWAELLWLIPYWMLEGDGDTDDKRAALSWIRVVQALSRDIYVRLDGQYWVLPTHFFGRETRLRRGLATSWQLLRSLSRTAVSTARTALLGTMRACMDFAIATTLTQLTAAAASQLQKMGTPALLTTLLTSNGIVVQILFAICGMPMLSECIFLLLDKVGAGIRGAVERGAGVGSETRNIASEKRSLFETACATLLLGLDKAQKFLDDSRKESYEVPAIYFVMLMRWANLQTRARIVDIGLRCGLGREYVESWTETFIERGLRSGARRDGFDPGEAQTNLEKVSHSLSPNVWRVVDRFVEVVEKLAFPGLTFVPAVVRGLTSILLVWTEATIAEWISLFKVPSPRAFLGSVKAALDSESPLERLVNAGSAFETRIRKVSDVLNTSAQTFVTLYETFNGRTSNTDPFHRAEIEFLDELRALSKGDLYSVSPNCAADSKKSCLLDEARVSLRDVYTRAFRKLSNASESESTDSVARRRDLSELTPPPQSLVLDEAYFEVALKAFQPQQKGEER
jgi:hypothetical protein